MPDHIGPPRQNGPDQPDVPGPQQRPASRLDQANPYATYRPAPAYSPQPPQNPYAAGQSVMVPDTNPPTNPYPAQHLPGHRAPFDENPYPAGQYSPPSYPGPVAPETHAVPKRRKGSHRKLWATLATVVVIGGALTAAAFVMKPSFLGFTKVLDHSALEKTIEQQSAGRFSDVTCPANVKVKAGATFLCSAADGKKVKVVLGDDKGAYVWLPAN